MSMRWWFTLAAIVTLVSISSSQTRLRAGELDIGIVDPIGKVGEIGKVGPIDKVVDGKGALGGGRSLADTGYVVCWSWNLAKEPKWRCTQQYADLPQAREFSNYQNGRYELGQSFFLPVYKKEWDDTASRKIVMERVQKGAIPKAMERVAGREDDPSRNPERAALIRKQIQFVQPEWVDVKPVLPQGVKATDARPSKKIGYDDDAPKANIGAILTRNDWRENKMSRERDGRILYAVSVYKFKDDKSAEWYSSGYTSRESNYDRLYAEALKEGPTWKGKWSVRKDGRVDLVMRLLDSYQSTVIDVLEDEIVQNFDGGSTTRYKKAR